MACAQPLSEQCKRLVGQIERLACGSVQLSVGASGNQRHLRVGAQNIVAPLLTESITAFQPQSPGKMAHSQKPASAVRRIRERNNLRGLRHSLAVKCAILTCSLSSG